MLAGSKAFSGFAVDDLEAAKRFYGETLGLNLEVLDEEFGLMTLHLAGDRDTIVYLTCLHELGHALGLAHTADFEDVMYFFGLGGDLEEFFGRYRRALSERGDIRTSSGLSAGDLEQLRALYGPTVPAGELTVAN